MNAAPSTQGKAALITGGAKRVGRAIALRLATEGYDILLHYHRSRDEAVATQKDIEALGRRCLPMEADLSDVRMASSLISYALQQMPHCSLLVNSASIFEQRSFLESDVAICDRHFSLNFGAPVFLTQAFAKKAQRGCVINLLDTAITQNKHSHFFYLLSKKALAEFTRMAAAELAPAIRVNGVCPGIVLTGGGWDETYMQRKEASVPLRKLGSVEAVCEAVYWLAEQDRITGQFIFVDGGEHLI